MWIPFQNLAECVENHNETGSEIHGFILFVKYAGNNAGNGMK